MKDEGVRQRIAYLVQHGGLYPKERPAWFWWAVVVVALQLAALADRWMP